MTFRGLAGFPKPSESIHDAFIAGHASNSVAVALGMARARSALGADYKVLAVIGDGALTGCLLYTSATMTWDAATEVVSITRGSGAIQSGDSYYDQEDLFWLSRVIYAESGNQPLEGKMAVGNVVMNRVASPIYPNTVEGVLAQKNQF